MAEMESALTDATVEALAAALRIFAARGRAIREARAQSGNPLNHEFSERANSADAPRLGEPRDDSHDVTALHSE